MDIATAAATASGDSTNVIQHVTKKSSDELLRKFAELGDSNNARKKKKMKREDGGTTLVERRSLLPPAAMRKTALLRRLGIGRAHMRARDIRNKTLLGTIEKVTRLAELALFFTFRYYAK